MRKTIYPQFANNYFQFGYNQCPFNSRILSTDRQFYRVLPNINQEETYSFFDANLNAAKRIGSLGYKIAIPLSGGIDSEYVARVFLKAGVPFTPYVFSFNNGLNEHDISYAKSFCKKNSLKFREITLDIVNFFESNKYIEYSSQYSCASPQIVTHLFMLDHIDEFIVLPGQVASFSSKNPDLLLQIKKSEKYNEFYENENSSTNPKNQSLEFTRPEEFYKALPKIIMHLAPDNLDLTYARYFQLNHKPSVIQFFYFTFNQITSSFRHKLTQKSLSKNQLFSYELKKSIYANDFPQMNDLRTKATGFEKVKEFFSNKFDERFRNPLKAIYPMAHDRLLYDPKNFQVE